MKLDIKDPTSEIISELMDRPERINIGITFGEFAIQMRTIGDMVHIELLKDGERINENEAKMPLSEFLHYLAQDYSMLNSGEEAKA